MGRRVEVNRRFWPPPGRPVVFEGSPATAPEQASQAADVVGGCVVEYEVVAKLRHRSSLRPRKASGVAELVFEADEAVPSIRNPISTAGELITSLWTLFARHAIQGAPPAPKLLAELAFSEGGKTVGAATAESPCSAPYIAALRRAARSVLQGNRPTVEEILNRRRRRAVDGRSRSRTEMSSRGARHASDRRTRQVPGG